MNRSPVATACRFIDLSSLAAARPGSRQRLLIVLDGLIFRPAPVRPGHLPPRSNGPRALSSRLAPSDARARRRGADSPTASSRNAAPRMPLAPPRPRQRRVCDVADQFVLEAVLLISSSRDTGSRRIRSRPSSESSSSVRASLTTSVRARRSRRSFPRPQHRATPLARPAGARPSCRHDPPDRGR